MGLYGPHPDTHGVRHTPEYCRSQTVSEVLDKTQEGGIGPGLHRNESLPPGLLGTGYRSWAGQALGSTP